MKTGISVNRGDVVLLPIAFVSGVGTKVRPAIVVQNDTLNRRLNSTVAAIITSTNLRAHSELSQVFIDITTSNGKLTGLLHDSTVKAEHIDMVDQREIMRTIGRFSPRVDGASGTSDQGCDGFLLTDHGLRFRCGQLSACCF